ncbi:hypothetical protein LINGRAHAP2_LOCUS36328, partial [Linum grandiflorum]
RLSIHKAQPHKPVFINSFDISSLSKTLDRKKFNTMTVFIMDSDNQFIRAEIYTDSANAILVCQYEEDTSIIDMIRARCPRWTQLARIPLKNDAVTMTALQASYAGRSKISYSALEVFGVTIRGASLTTLARDLIINNGRKMYLAVNRRGVCFVDIG